MLLSLVEALIIYTYLIDILIMKTIESIDERRNANHRPSQLRREPVALAWKKTSQRRRRNIASYENSDDAQARRQRLPN